MKNWNSSSNKLVLTNGVKAPGEDDYTIGNQLFFQTRYQESVVYLLRSAKEGYPASFLRLGRIYFGDSNFPKDSVKTQNYFKEIESQVDWFLSKASMTNSGDDLFNVALFYSYILKDDALEIKYYRLAANKGYAPAQRNLGMCYDRGKGVERDCKEGLRYALLSSEQGYQVAHCDIGISYHLAKGIRRDYSLAYKYYQLAAAQGYAIARYNIGILYQEGLGVPQDRLIALEHHRYAAKHGYVLAQYCYGVLLEEGFSGEGEKIYAQKFFQLAADQGEERIKGRIGEGYVIGGRSACNRMMDHCVQMMINKANTTFLLPELWSTIITSLLDLQANKPNS